MTNYLLNRIAAVIKTNKSGGAHALGDVCVEDGANANSVINDTSGAFADGVVWVCIEPGGVASNAQGFYACAGYVPQINLDASATLGDVVKTSTTTKKGTPHAVPLVAGDFAQVLGAGTSPAAVLFAPNQGGVLGGGRTLISSQTPSGVSSVTFSSIAGTYSKLTLEILARSSNGANGVDAYLQFNSDTTSANYIYELPRWNASGSANDVAINYKIATTTIPGTAAPANEFAVGKIEIIAYANTSINKKALAHWAAQYDNAAVYLQSQVGALTWLNTAAITDIVFALSAGNFAAGSVVNLYGE